MPVSELIGRYRPSRRIGAGGFAVVWLAHDESLHAEVAVKVMADNWSDRLDLRERFLQEARLLRQASSYRIVQVFDIGELDDGRPYLVMEYADRGTLADRVKANGPYPLAEALRILAEVARGVAELHAAGVVHRDLKPSNVLISSVRGGGERLLLADLGVAKSLAHGSGVTMSVGSAGYMAPEQSEPQIGVDVRADVYSLGAFAYHLITAQQPGWPLVLREKLPADLPRPVRETLLQTLVSNPEERWPDAASLAERFDELADLVENDLTVVAPPDQAGPAASTGYPPVTWSAPAQEPGRPNHGPQGPPPTATASSPAGHRPAPAGHRPAPGGQVHGGRRGRWVVGTAVLLVLAVAIGAVGAFYQHSRSSAELTAVSEDEVISLTVPAAFGPELVDSGWDPGSIGLKGDRTSGLLLADQVGQWSDLASDVNGVFVGVSGNRRLPAKVAAITHDSCENAGSRSYRSSSWSGTITTWTNCSGAERTLREVALKPLTTGQNHYVYLQIRQANDDHTAQELIDGLVVNG